MVSSAADGSVARSHEGEALEFEDPRSAFSLAGDKVFAELSRRFPEADAKRLALAQRLPDARFSEIHHAVRAYISSCFGYRAALPEAEVLELLLGRKDDLHNYTPGGMLLPKREQTLEFNQVHRSVAAAFSDYSFSDLVDGIDLPINVRLVYGDVSGARLAPFSSAKLHSDVWAGVPADAVVVVLPVLGDIDDLTIVCGEMERERELPCMRAMGDYDEGRDVKMAVPYRDVVLQHGHVYLADVRLLHQTVRRRKGGVRVSIDFRFRLNDLRYRQMVPSTIGPESLDTRVPYLEWQGIGTRSLVVFDETMEDARVSRHRQSSLPVYDGPYRILRMFPEP